MQQLTNSIWKQQHSIVRTRINIIKCGKVVIPQRPKTNPKDLWNMWRVKTKQQIRAYKLAHSPFWLYTRWS